MTERDKQIIKAGFKVLLKFLTFFLMDTRTQQSNHYYAYAGFREEIEEIVNKL